MPYLSTPLQRSGGSIPASSGSRRSRSSSSSSALLAACASVSTASSSRVGAAPSQLSVMHSLHFLNCLVLTKHGYPLSPLTHRGRFWLGIQAHGNPPASDE